MREVETLCRPNRNPRICVIVNVMLEFRMTPEQRTRALPMCRYNGAISENRARDASSWANTRARANEKCALALHAIYFSVGLWRYSNELSV